MTLTLAIVNVVVGFTAILLTLRVRRAPDPAAADTPDTHVAGRLEQFVRPPFAACQ